MIRLVTVLVIYLLSLVSHSQTKFEQEASSKTVSVSVTVPNITSNKGVVLFALYTKENFMQKPLAGKEGKITNGKTEITFKNVPPGSYAIICYHDSIENQRMDFDESGMPKEDWGMTNNPVLMGPPTFEAAKFTVENKSVDLTIKF